MSLSPFLLPDTFWNTNDALAILKLDGTNGNSSANFTDQYFTDIPLYCTTNTFTITSTIEMLDALQHK